MNWAGFAFKCAQTDFKLGSDIMNITANYLTSLTKEAALKAKSRNLGIEAENWREQSTWSEKQAGELQKSGRAQRESRLIQLGQDTGAMFAGAAGSGIDVSSKVVGKTVADTARSAYNDTAQMAVNEQAEVQSKMNDASAARQNAIFTEENQMWVDFAADLEESNRKWGVVAGALGAAGNWAGGMAGAGSALFGG